MKSHSVGLIDCVFTTFVPFLLPVVCVQLPHLPFIMLKLLMAITLLHRSLKFTEANGRRKLKDEKTFVLCKVFTSVFIATKLDRTLYIAVLQPLSKVD